MEESSQPRERGGTKRPQSFVFARVTTSLCRHFWSLDVVWKVHCLFATADLICELPLDNTTRTEYLYVY